MLWIYQAFNVLVTVQTLGHVSWILWSDRPAPSKVYSIVRHSDSMMHALLAYKTTSYLHGALFVTHTLKNCFGLYGARWIDTIDMLAYLNSFLKLPRLGMFLPSVIAYTFLKNKGLIW